MATKKKTPQWTQLGVPITRMWVTKRDDANYGENTPEVLFAARAQINHRTGHKVWRLYVNAASGRHKVVAGCQTHTIEGYREHVRETYTPINYRYDWAQRATASMLILDLFEARLNAWKAKRARAARRKK